MAKLHYSAITSLDGYIADSEGNFDWAMPDAEVHAFINDRERPIGTNLFGRRMYEVMMGWETMHEQPDLAQEYLDFAALWRASDKIVYSRTLGEVSTARTHLEREFDPETVREMKSRLSHDMSIAGADLGAEAMQHGLVDEIHLYLAQCIVGGGTRTLPDGLRLDLQLLEERRFEGGMVYLRYGVVS